MIGRSPEAVKEQIRQANDIVDVVSACVTLQRAGRDFKALCPFHREKTPSFQVSPEKQIFKCFGCGAGGDVFKFIQLREGVGFREAIAILAARAGIELDTSNRHAGTASGPSKADLARVNAWACRWFAEQLHGPGGDQARDYVAQRGISDESLKRFAIGLAPVGWETLCEAARKQGIPTPLLLAAGLVKKRPDGTVYDGFRHRLMFPIRDALDRVIGFGGRALDDDPAKYLNSPQSVIFDKRHCLYGLATAKTAFQECRTAIVVEGYVDCIMAQQAGFGHTVATLGTALTAEHIQILRRYVDRVVLVFDSDQAGRRAADQSLALFITGRLDVRLAHVPQGKDPADLLQTSGMEAFEQVLTSATDALEFKWNQLLRRYREGASGPDRRRAVEEFLGLIARSTDLGACDPIQRGLILNQVGKLLGLPSEEVYRQLRIVGRRAGSSPNTNTTGPAQKALPTPHAVAAAMRELLEVLINEPGYYASVASEFDPQLLLDPELKEIAAAFQELAQEKCQVTLADLTSRFEHPPTARRIVDLQIAGERRGNYAATVQGAVVRLREAKSQSMIRECLEDYRRQGARAVAGPGEGASGEVGLATGPAEVSRVRAVSEAARKMNHFAARKHLATLTSTGAGRGE